MKFASILSLVCVAVSPVASHVGDRFNSWLNEYNVPVSDNASYLIMLNKWVSNDEFIDEHNAKNLTHVLGHNQFSAMDAVDYKQFLGFSSKFERPVHHGVVTMLGVAETATTVNWVEGGAVTSVKDQGQCGSCWAFSTTGALEGAYYAKNGKLVSFSEQELVDCDTLRNGGRDQGCNGGLMDNAFSYITKNGGLCLEADYPYFSGDTQDQGTCQKTCSVYPGSKVTKYVDVLPSDDAQMMAALSLQPVAIAIEADQREFQLYKSGVFAGACGTTLDHGVLAVGYGTENGSDYYLVKNSWGESWGDSGYIKLGKGTSYNGGDGQCGLLLSASYPLV